MRTKDKLKNTWVYLMNGIRGKFGYYKGHPVIKPIHPFPNPCRKVIASQAKFGWLFDFCMEARRLYWLGVPPKVLEEAYFHFRKNPHFKPKEVWNYVKKRYQEQNRPNDGSRRQ